MSITTSICFLKLSPPPPSSTNPKQVIPTSSSSSCRSRPSERSLARRCAAGMACVAIGLELLGPIQHAENLALAVGDPKWSDKRTCPAWQMNSLETIVPENLPRPSASRRWEMVGFDLSGTDPATVRIRVFRNGNGCFSM